MLKNTGQKKPAKAKKPRLKRAPNAPKRFKSAFMFFSENRHKEIRQQSQDKKILASEVAKTVSKEWKALAAEDKVEWEEKASKDRERYYQEKAAYKGPWKIPKAKHPDAPKKPMSAFLAYSNERRKTIAESNPGMGNAEISRVLAKLWKECPNEIKGRYREKEATDRAKFKEAMAEWEQAQYASPELSGEIDEAESKSAVPPATSPSPSSSLQWQESIASSSLPQQYLSTHQNQHQHAYTQSSLLPAAGAMGHGVPFHAAGTGQIPPAMLARGSMDNMSMLMNPSLTQQFLALAPVPLSAASSSGGQIQGNPLPSQASAWPVMDPSMLLGGSSYATQSVSSQYQTGLPGQLPAQSQTQNTHQPLDPFIDTDTGGYLAAFAALERSDGDGKTNTKTDQRRDSD